MWSWISERLSYLSLLFHRYFCSHDENPIYLKIYLDDVKKWKKSYAWSNFKYGKCKIKIRCMKCRKVVLLRKEVTVDVDNNEIVMVDSRTLKR